MKGGYAFMDKQYSIIREQGEFMEPIDLDERENAIVNNSDDDGNEEE